MSGSSSLWTAGSDETSPPLSPAAATNLSGPPDGDARAALVKAAVDVANALAGSLRVASFYEADHPVARQRRGELDVLVRDWHQALAHAGCKDGAIVAAAGETLVLSGLEDGLRNAATEAFCDVLVQKSVVGVRLRAPTSSKDLADLFGLLGESHQRIRAAGGVTRMFVERGARSVDVFEMDLEQLLSGAPIDRTNLDPLVARALTEILALKARANRRGAAVTVTLERVTTPASLGSVLDELIDGAAPGVAVSKPKSSSSSSSSASSSASSTSPLHGLTADELADIGGEAFQKCASDPRSTPDALAEAARVLSGALVRLSPEARFKLLQKIAGASHGKSDDAAAAVGREVTNPLLLSAVVQVVMGGARDSKLANAIGGLLERLRPIERDRQRFLAELNDSARAAGRPLEGLFLEELNESAQQSSYGALNLPIRETRAALIEVARLRQRGPQPDVVLRTFASLREEDRLARSARLVCALLEEERVVMPATLTTVRAILTMPPTDPSMAGTGGAVIQALWWRAIRDGRASPAATHLGEIARAPAGDDWCIALLIELRGRKGPDLAALLIDLLRTVTAVHQSESFRRRLVEVLHGLDAVVLRQIERRVAELPPTGAQAMILRAGRDSSAAALNVAQLSLRAPNADLKEASLRALALCADEGTVQFLRKAAGAEGESTSVQLLSAQKEDGPTVFRLQRTAVEALGATKAAVAVPALEELLHRTQLVGGAELDRLRQFVGRALVINNTREARAVIEAGRKAKAKSVRLACGATT